MVTEDVEKSLNFSESIGNGETTENTTDVELVKGKQDINKERRNEGRKTLAQLSN